MNTTYFLNLVAGNVLKTKTTPAIPSKYYIGLSSTSPSMDGTGVTEPSSSGAYARVELSGLSEPASGVVTNSAEIAFDESTASWGTVTHFVIYDAKTGGNLLMYGPLSSNRTVEAGTLMVVRPNSLSLSVINP